MSYSLEGIIHSNTASNNRRNWLIGGNGPVCGIWGLKLRSIDFYWWKVHTTCCQEHMWQCLFDSPWLGTLRSLQQLSMTAFESACLSIEATLRISGKYKGISTGAGLTRRPTFDIPLNRRNRLIKTRRALMRWDELNRWRMKTDVKNLYAIEVPWMYSKARRHVSH